MVAYQAKCDLVRAVAPRYGRVEDQDRTLTQSVLGVAADITVAADNASSGWPARP